MLLIIEGLAMCFILLMICNLRLHELTLVRHDFLLRSMN